MDELVAVMEKKTILALTDDDDDLHDMMENSGNGLIARLYVPSKYPKRECYMKVLKRLWGGCISYTELGIMPWWLGLRLLRLGVVS